MTDLLSELGCGSFSFVGPRIFSVFGGICFLQKKYLCTPETKSYSTPCAVSDFLGK